jgi:phenylacetate-CoA oxygenase PaaH subunit
MDVWEVLIQEDRTKFPVNVGSVRAPNATLAMEFAREVFARREKTVRVMVVKRNDIFGISDEKVLSMGPNKQYRLPSLGRKTKES